MISLMGSSLLKLTTDDENLKNKIKKKHSTIIKEQHGKYCCVYSIDDEGKKTLLKKIPRIDTDDTNKKDFNNLFNFNNPKFVSESVINNTRASMKFIQDKFHKDDVKEIIKLLKPETL